MILSDKIKTLIADGKTQQALDLLEGFLKTRDKDLLNQTYLLESQYKDLQRKVQLGLQNAEGELNRVNLTLLKICDEVENLETTSSDTSSNKSFSGDNTEGGNLLRGNAAQNPLLVFGVLVGIGILLFGSIAAIKGCDTDPANPTTAPNTLQPTEPKEQTWTATSAELYITDKLNGNLKFKIKSVAFDTSDMFIIGLDATCLKSYTGKCLSSNLRYELVLPNGEHVSANDEQQAEGINPADIRDDHTGELMIDFPVNRTMKACDFRIFYDNKPATAVSVHIAAND